MFFAIKKSTILSALKHGEGGLLDDIIFNGFVKRLIQLRLKKNLFVMETIFSTSPPSRPYQNLTSNRAHNLTSVTSSKLISFGNIVAAVSFPVIRKSVRNNDARTTKID